MASRCRASTAFLGLPGRLAGPEDVMMAIAKDAVSRLDNLGMTNPPEKQAQRSENFVAAMVSGHRGNTVNGQNQSFGRAA